jgi:DNA-binding MurR/RpiR family transcriptional regulator
MTSYVERIRQVRSILSPSFERIADFILDSYAQVALLTATELGHTLDIDTATVVRFAQQLGYKGYPELQREIREKLKREFLGVSLVEPRSASEAADNALSEIAQSLDLTRKTFPLEQAEALINALDEAQRVILLAEGLALGPARNLAAWLEAAGYNIHISSGSLSDLARALVGARKGDMVIIIEVDDETPYLAEAINEAKALDLRTAAIVSSPSSPAAQFADLHLAAYKTPQSGVDQIMVEAIIYAFMRMLHRARPGRFETTEERIAQVMRNLSKNDRG